MNDNNEVLLEIAHRLESKYGVKPGIFHELGEIVFEGVGTPTEPIIPEEVNEALQQVGNKFGLKTGALAYIVNNGNLVITMHD